jgi:hypothetical protein
VLGGKFVNIRPETAEKKTENLAIWHCILAQTGTDYYRLMV